MAPSPYVDPPEIRPARPHERESVRELILAGYEEFAPVLEPQHWTTMRGNILRALDAVPDGQLLVALEREQLVGTVTYYPPGPREFDQFPFEWSVIRLLAVHPHCRGRGLGRLLTEACVATASHDGAPAVGLHTGEMMDPAMRIYERMGFTRHRSYAHLGVTFWVYVLQLAAHNAAPHG
jgi:ribosomal protein S18 acetylase RimI-like enzyme